MSAVELLGRLAAADERRLRLSRLAADTGLSLSRVSRIVDTLEARALVERRPCPSDARAINAHLTDAGLMLAREAQATHFADVQRRFFDHLEADEVALLARLFSRFAPRDANCVAGRAARSTPQPAKTAPTSPRRTALSAVQRAPASATSASRSTSPSNTATAWPESSRGHSANGRSQASSRSLPSGSEM